MQGVYVILKLTEEAILAKNNYSFQKRQKELKKKKKKEEKLKRKLEKSNPESEIAIEDPSED